MREETAAAAKAARVDIPMNGVSREKACFNCRSWELVCSRPAWVSSFLFFFFDLAISNFSFS